MDNNLSEIVITKIRGANHINATPNIYTFRQNRDCWAIALKITGSTEYLCEDEKVISDRSNIVILPKGSSYRWKSYGGECLIVDFDADMIFDKLYSFNVKDCFKLINRFQQIENNRITADPLGSMKNIGILYEMLIYLLQTQRQAYYPSKKYDLISPAIEYISKNYNTPSLNNSILSKIAGISETYFRKIFTEIYGCPPMEYINRLRMSKAGEMLKSDYNSIESIARSVGYNSVYHFSKMFKRHYGISPSNYGKIYR